jgi:WhiB family transcriptional regulator, redox-sensing transcriptional regulator
MPKPAAMVNLTRLPAPSTAVWEWQMRAACREIDNTVFFHPDYERGPAREARNSRAKSICRGCPVILACRRHALAVREPYGVWGGLTLDERAAILRRSDFPLSDTPASL